MQHIIDRFISYVTIDTESDPNSKTTPSTEKQWNLANKLVEELKAIGLTDVTIDDKAYIMATLPSNVDHEVPTIGFVSHFDTSPDFSGANVKPQIVENYDGKDIVLNAEKNIILSPDYFKDLLQYKGQTIITTDGTTLLGADDKAGITEIVSAMEYLIQHPEIKHGKIRIGFTPDEEIGRGAHHFDVEKFGAQWAYTMDGSQIGELEYENFNAAGAKITFKGKSVHPGYAKGKMINSMLLANEFINELPKGETPQETKGYEGFFHVHHLTGSIEETVLELIIRDHNKKKFEKRKELIEKIAKKFNKKFAKKFGEDIVITEIRDQYYNMKEKVLPVKHIVDIAEKAMRELNIKPIIKPIRGGTDGSQLSFMGLPCPNIFAGGHNFHGKYEYVPAESIQKATDVIVKIAELTAVPGIFDTPEKPKRTR
ncbi:peptidase T [Flavobacterium johnsoniae]|jgi:tripeptide aminopeptidase|uniref:Peptidase T n=2 Tax=Flavobacterium johnsoniae TaxID=986 RepID=A0A1M5PV13_FLAJO|nr:peptidase T [Flavobacterium johnsoniae]ABQ05233.1 peptidase T [Flavobacterium johnsoniae UW101]OXE96944.1 peptidase T [Flavobacterium johnsoniae UW101]WQG82965.1 peptidase T [Flavobacterium johnsoniae UW101]SHH05446.1 tripeptide aminopeptidase [Flavobacterium johnsoniae]SHL62897.1 tripeptide aminopeptidase [Flavobacterium johnsoniae]